MPVVAIHPFVGETSKDLPVNGHLLHADGTVTDATSAAVGAPLESEPFFWLDLPDLDDEGMGYWPTDSSSIRWRWRTRSTSVSGRRSTTTTASSIWSCTRPQDGSGTVEVHFFYSERYLVTVRRGECQAIDTLRKRLAGRPRDQQDGRPIMLLYQVLDAVVDTFFPVLSQFDDKIDELEDAILERPTDEQLGTLFEMKRSLVNLRKVVTPERDMFAGLVSGVAELPGMTVDAERYFRDLYDHLIRVSDLVDSYRDLLTGAMDTHLSTVSNRLNEVMKQLTMIATVFLPLSFLTGFFGQNFGWMVKKLGSLAAFLSLAIGLEVVAAVALLVLFRRRGWLGQS